MNVNWEVLISLVIGCAGLWLRAEHAHMCRHTDYDKTKPLKWALMRRGHTGSTWIKGGSALPGWLDSPDPVRKSRAVVDCLRSARVNLVACFDDPMWRLASHWWKGGACRGKTNHKRKLMVDVSLYQSIILNHLMMPAWAITKSLVSQSVVCKNSSYML